MKQYDHAFTVAFSIQTNAKNVEDICKTEFLEAIKRRNEDLYNNDEYVEALGIPYDTIDNFADYPVEDWKYQVANGDTILGYRDWASRQIEANQ